MNPAIDELEVRIYVTRDYDNGIVSAAAWLGDPRPFSDPIDQADMPMGVGAERRIVNRILGSVRLWMAAQRGEELL
jgi:hypothetical protein